MFPILVPTSIEKADAKAAMDIYSRLLKDRIIFFRGTRVNGTFPWPTSRSSPAFPLFLQFEDDKCLPHANQRHHVQAHSSLPGSDPTPHGNLRHYNDAVRQARRLRNCIWPRAPRAWGPYCSTAGAQASATPPLAPRPRIRSTADWPGWNGHGPTEASRFTAKGKSCGASI